MSGDNFHSVENLKLLVKIFKDYMKDKYNIVLEYMEEESQIKKDMYDHVMLVVKDEDAVDLPLQKKNIRVLNMVKEVYVRKFDLNNSTKKSQHMQSLTRDKSVFGSRQLNTNIIMPEMDAYQRNKEDSVKDGGRILDKIVLERDRALGIEKKELPDVNKVIRPMSDNAESKDDFLKKLKSLEDERNRLLGTLPSTPSAQSSISPQAPMMDRIAVEAAANKKNYEEQMKDPKLIVSQLYQAPTLPTKKTSQDASSLASLKEVFETYIPQEQSQNDKENSIIQRTMMPSKIQEKYLSINSTDRDFESEPYRYQYTVSFAGTNDNNMHTNFRNIESIRVTSVIIPNETIHTSNASSQIVNFEYPYLILKIEEFTDVYDGTNDIVRRAFCKLTFSDKYTINENGRGYIVLKPMQDEIKVFYPTPLASFSKLSMSLLRPNGTLYKKTSDSIKVSKIEYDNTKPNYIKVTTNQYFDGNTFATSDEIHISGFQMTKLSPSQIDNDIRAFNEYILRSEGFNIQDLGAANANGYYNTIYIEAPGNVDTSIGQFQVKTNIINCLNTFNAQSPAPELFASSLIINASLQNTISVTLRLVVDDSSHVPKFTFSPKEMQY